MRENNTPISIKRLPVYQTNFRRSKINHVQSSYIIETDDPALIREARARVKKNQRRIAAGLSPYDDIDRKLVGALGGPQL